MGVIVFGGGASLNVPGGAMGLMNSLARVARREQVHAQGIPLPAGFVDVHTEQGVVYVNPAQVAYVADVPAQEPVLDKPG